MRRYSVTEAPRAVLLEDLLKLIATSKHLHPEQPERAEAYQQAYSALSAGEVEVSARSKVFRVANFSADFYGVIEGTREELLAELDRYGADRHQQGKEAKARRYAKAIAQVGKGAVEVEVDRIRYRVVED